VLCSNLSIFNSNSSIFRGADEDSPVVESVSELGQVAMSAGDFFTAAAVRQSLVAAPLPGVGPLPPFPAFFGSLPSPSSSPSFGEEVEGRGVGAGGVWEKSREEDSNASAAYSAASAVSLVSAEERAARAEVLPADAEFWTGNRITLK
jgi:hypothetical protein